MSGIKNFDNFLNENIGSGENYNFSTYIKNMYVDINFIEYCDEFKELNISKETYSIDEKDFVIEWSLILDIRKYGVKDISLYIKSVRGRFIVEEWMEDRDDKQHQIDFDSDINDFDIVSEVEITSAISPENIEIDFKNKKIIIT